MTATLVSDPDPIVWIEEIYGMIKEFSDSSSPVWYENTLDLMYGAMDSIAGMTVENRDRVILWLLGTAVKF